MHVCLTYHEEYPFFFCPLGKWLSLSLKIWLRHISIWDVTCKESALALWCRTATTDKLREKKDKWNVWFVIYVFKKGTWHYMKVQTTDLHLSQQTFRLLRPWNGETRETKGAAMWKREMKYNSFGCFGIHLITSLQSTAPRLTPCRVLLSPTISHSHQLCRCFSSTFFLCLTQNEEAFMMLRGVWWAVRDNEHTSGRISCFNFILMLIIAPHYCQ